MKRLIFLLVCFLPVLISAQIGSQQAIKNDPDYKTLENLLKPIEQKAETLTAEFRSATKAQKEDEQYVRSMNTKYAAVFSEFKQTLKKFIADHPNSQVSLAAFSQLMQGDFDARELDSVFNSISAEVKNSEAGRSLASQYLSLKKLAIGAEAPAFTQNDQDGKPVNLSDFRGKYVLLDFWASWCGPCRKENPNVVKAYNNLKDKNFEILGISLDNTKNAWLNAVQKDQLSWPQVSDLKGWKNEVAILYGVQSIPQNFLLDPNGIIIAKNLRGEELAAKLAELLK